MDKIEVELGADTTEANKKVDELRDRIEATGEKLVNMGNDVERATKDSFNEVMGMMRASYSMVSGITQAIGGKMSAIFSSMFSIGIAAIGTYQAVAAAIAASGVGLPQALLMTASLVTASAQLVMLMTGQDELSRRVAGLNTALHGIGGMIGVIGF